MQWNDKPTQQASLSAHKRSCCQTTFQGHIPIPRRVLQLVIKKADVDHDGFVDYQEFCDVILHNKEDFTAKQLTGLEKVSARE